ncbi:hypothetical protein B0H11DRAFT_1994781 [Mycena galericulata]|nr:hypothetical protein B0H11DRAFT_1994781 [Mycena galericulata]
MTISNVFCRQQWEVSAGPVLQSVDGIFAFSSPFTIQNVTTATSASATSSNTATSSGSHTQSVTGTSAQLTPSPSAINSSTTSQAKASASSSASAVPIKSSPSVGIIVGATFGATAFLLIALLLTFLYLRRMRRRRRMDAKEPILEAAFTPYAASSAYGYSSTNSMSQQQHANVEPFMPEPHVSPVEMSEPAPSLSSRASRARQEYLTSQMRAVQKQLEALEGARAMAAASQTTSGSDAMSSSGSEGDTGGLEQARRQNEALQERIRALEGQLQSQWALGLSDEPPPGYLE